MPRPADIATMAHTLREGHQFKWMRGQRVFRFVAKLHEFRKEDKVPSHYVGKLLVIMDDCRQVMLDPTSEIFIPADVPQRWMDLGESMRDTRESREITFKCGFKTLICHCLKNRRVHQTYWFWVRTRSGAWYNFDIRQSVPDWEEKHAKGYEDFMRRMSEWMEKEPSEWLWRVGGLLQNLLFDELNDGSREQAVQEMVNEAFGDDDLPF